MSVYLTDLMFIMEKFSNYNCVSKLFHCSIHRVKKLVKKKKIEAFASGGWGWGVGVGRVTVFLVKKDFVKENMALRAQFQMLKC